MPRKKINLEQLLLIGSEIEKIVEEANTDYMDACIEYCKTHDVEIEAIGEIIKKNPKIKAKIQEEAESLNFLEKSSRLEFND